MLSHLSVVTVQQQSSGSPAWCRPPVSAWSVEDFAAVRDDDSESFRRIRMILDVLEQRAGARRSLTDLEQNTGLSRKEIQGAQRLHSSHEVLVGRGRGHAVGIRREQRRAHLHAPGRGRRAVAGGQVNGLTASAEAYGGPCRRGPRRADSRPARPTAGVDTLVGT